LALDPVLDAAPVAPAAHETGFAEDPHVVGEQVGSHPKVILHLAQAVSVSSEVLQDRQPRRVPEGSEAAGSVGDCSFKNR
jgi:hypothetical protein